MAGAAVQPTNGVEKSTTKPTKNGSKTKISPEAKTLQDKIEHFEKLKGLTNQRERLVGALGNLNKFVYNQGHSVSFTLVDGNDQEFKTSNTELIKIVVDGLKSTLDKKKEEIEKDILAFIF